MNKVGRQVTVHFSHIRPILKGSLYLPAGNLPAWTNYAPRFVSLWSILCFSLPYHGGDLWRKTRLWDLNITSNRCGPSKQMKMKVRIHGLNQAIRSSGLIHTAPRPRVIVVDCSCNCNLCVLVPTLSCTKWWPHDVILSNCTHLAFKEDCFLLEGSNCLRQLLSITWWSLKLTLLQIKSHFTTFGFQIKYNHRTPRIIIYLQCVYKLND